MPRPPALPPQQKVKLVLAVLAKEKTIAEAARQAQVSEQSVANWRKQFIDGGVSSLHGTAVSRSTDREQELLSQVRQLKAALGEAYVELIAVRRAGGFRRLPSRTSS